MLPSVDSMLNENNTKISHVFLKSQIDYHKEIAPFARRPLTTFLMEGTSKSLGLKSGYAFILVNFLLLFLSGILIYKLSKNLNARRKQGLTNMLVYFLSFSVLFAFFPPVFTYDEPLQYCLILSSLIAFVKKKWLGYIALFTLALITRETSMLIVPAIILFISSIGLQGGKLFSQPHVKRVLIALCPLLLYAIFIGIYIWKNQLLEATRNEMASRYTCFLENFESSKNTVESVTPIFLSLGPFLYFSLRSLKKNQLSQFKRRFVNAFLVTVTINTPIVILTAFARESRLFALPLLFIWPMFMQLFEREIKILVSFNLYKTLFFKSRYAIPFVLLNILNFWLCFRFYDSLGVWENNFFSEYLFLLNFFLLAHFFLSLLISAEKNSRNDFS